MALVPSWEWNHNLKIFIIKKKYNQYFIFILYYISAIIWGNQRGKKNQFYLDLLLNHNIRT